jgi:hypothetical protein
MVIANIQQRTITDFSKGQLLIIFMLLSKWHIQT